MIRDQIARNVSDYRGHNVTWPELLAETPGAEWAVLSRGQQLLANARYAKTSQQVSGCPVITCM